MTPAQTPGVWEVRLSARKARTRGAPCNRIGRFSSVGLAVVGAVVWLSRPPELPREPARGQFADTRTPRLPARLPHPRRRPTGALDPGCRRPRGRLAAADRGAGRPLPLPLIRQPRDGPEPATRRAAE